MEQENLFPTKATRAKGKKAEENLQLQICAYIKLQYPNVIFTCDLASGMKLPIWLAARNKKMRSSRGLPDLFIAQIKHDGFEILHNGLFIELKKEGVTVKLKNGELPADDHIKEQAAILKRLREIGYRAEFACGFDEAKALIDTYLS